MKKKRKATILDRIKTALAIQGIIFIVIKGLSFIEGMPIVRRIFIRYALKGWLSNWNFEFLIS